MTRSWSTYFLIGGLAVLLVALGVLQYRWLSQISEADGEKARVRVREQADRFAADFNSQIQSAYFNFQNDAEVFKTGDWNGFSDQYEYWRERATYPDLISEIYFLPADLNAPALKFDRANRSFSPAEMPGELSDLRSKLISHQRFTPVDEASLTMVLPIHEAPRKVDHIVVRGTDTALRRMAGPPQRYGHLAIRLDPAVVKERLLPDLVAKYFADGEFRTAVVGTDGHAALQTISGDEPDASAPLFDLSPENFIFFGNKDLLSTIGAENRPKTSIRNSHVESLTYSRTETTTTKNVGNSVRVEIKTEPGPARTMPPGSDHTGPWTLQVQHVSGSIDAYVASTLRGNLAAGFGLLLLLATAVGAIFVSAVRSKVFAQRQIEFVSSVSHEFRTPLAVIYSAGENLADGVAKEQSQVERYGALIRGEGRKLSSMVEQILEFAGARSGKRRFKFAETDIANVVNAAVQECRPMIDEKKLDVETNVATDLPRINADAAALSQAIQNLIANSVKYSNGNGWLRVTAQNGAGSIRISVEDGGIGIPKSEQRRIFEPFYRSKEVVDAQIHGNGLGLSLVRQIVDAHGGTVRVESEPGKGSKFTIEIPG